MNDKGWEQVISYTGQKGCCAIWVDRAHLGYVVKTGFYEPSQVKEFACVGKEHAKTIYFWCIKQMNEEVAYA